MSADRMTETRTTIIGALLVAIGSMSMSLYTPAMPTLVVVFGVPIATIKLSLTLYFAGFAGAQLVVGPLSDAYGRRPVALAFIGLYVVASVIAMIAPTAEWLLAGRLLQGIGASAGVAISRAIVRDRFEGQQSARIMNAIALTMAVGPAASPTIGGLILAAFGWHAIFVFMAAFGVVLMALIGTQMPETLPIRDPSRFRPRRLFAGYLAIIGNLRFLRSAIVIGCTIGTLYASATMLPFVMIDKVGLTPVAFGIGMLAQSGSYIVGSIMTRFLMRRFPADGLVPVGIGFALAGGLLLAVFLRLGDPTYLSVMGPIGLIAFGIAFVQPGATTGALAPFPHIAGSAAALLGFMQTGGGLAGSLAAALLHEPLLALATVVPAMVVLAAAAHFGLGALTARNARRQLEARLGDELAPGE
jgi:DHA1 family bicyclomycin/chloramphenicol resistance-like MFS transporter